MHPRRTTAGVAVAALALTTAVLGQSAQARPTSAAPPSSPDVVRSALGNGLGRLVADAKAPSAQRRATSGFRIEPDALTIKDAEGRVLVDLTPRAGTDRAGFRRQAEAAGLSVTSVDTDRGTLEGYVALGSVQRLAGLAGTGTISQALKPQVATGSVDDQGVPFQRVDKVQAKGVNGKGITIGALSDSFDTATTTVAGDPLTIHAAQDVASGDLPGPGNPVNSKPVTVLEDSPTGADEGRAMLQIAHDVAPKAALCFATAEGGEVGFANNIRALADKKGACGADVVVDDISYLGEPFFSDGIISDAVDDVTAQGAQYFSSAGNSGAHQNWRSKVHLVPAQEAVKGTNLDFSNVPKALYDGGLQDMQEGPGVDPAQQIFIQGSGSIDLQWDDPFDLDGPTLGDPYFTGTGEITAADPEPTFSFTPTADQIGKTVQFRTDAIPSGTTDLILTVTAPDGTELGEVDTGSSPEVLVAPLTQSGTYTIKVSGFGGDTGDFTVDVRPVLAPSAVTTDFNVLLFNKAGKFLGASADINTLSGRPSEILTVGGLPEVQMVISRAGTGPVGATTLGNILFNGMYFGNHYDPLDPGTFGHHTAAGATAVAAYDPFKPYLPEYFTSPGGDLPIYFDSAGNRFRKPQIRRQPLVAAADGGNTTFFTSDTPRDDDTTPNFFGTSAAAPHAASIAALVLQKRGGPRSVSPAEMKRLLARSTFGHDLDPNLASSRRDGLTVTARGEQGDERRPYRGSFADPAFFQVSYDGKVPLRSLTFYGETASPTALGVTHPPLSDGIVFDTRPWTGVAPYREQGFPFTVGGTSGGLASASVSASFSGAGGPQTVAGQYRHMTLDFGSGLKRGQGLSFGIDRDLAVSGLGFATEGNGADELGGAVALPSGRALRYGLAFKAVRADGRVIWGTLQNRLGDGYTVVDGYGLINAEEAVLGSKGHGHGHGH